MPKDGYECVWVDDDDDDDTDTVTETVADADTDTDWCGACGGGKVFII